MGLTVISNQSIEELPDLRYFSSTGDLVSKVALSPSKVFSDLFCAVETAENMAPKTPPTKGKPPAPGKAASKGVPATKASEDSAAQSPPKKTKGLSSKHKECVRQVKGYFTLTGPINLNVFFPLFVVGEIIFKEGISALDPCLFEYLQELYPYQKALISSYALLFFCLIGIIGGVSLLRSAMASFDAVGGTIAPDDPPQTLVVTGPYAYVRNPLALAQLMILLSEGILAGVPKLLGLAAFYAVFLLIYTPCSEEPGLRSRFGADWIYYKVSCTAFLAFFPSFLPFPLTATSISRFRLPPPPCAVLQVGVGAWCPRCSPWEPAQMQV